MTYGNWRYRLVALYAVLAIVAAAAVLAFGKMAFAGPGTQTVYVDRPVLDAAILGDALGEPAAVFDGEEIGLEAGGRCRAWQRAGASYIICEEA